MQNIAEQGVSGGLRVLQPWVCAGPNGRCAKHDSTFSLSEFSVKVVRHIKSDLGCGKLRAAKIGNLPPALIVDTACTTPVKINKSWRDGHIFWSHRDSSGFADWIDEIFPGRRAELKLRASFYRKVDLKELTCVLRDIARREGAGAPSPTLLSSPLPKGAINLCASFIAYSRKIAS